MTVALEDSSITPLTNFSCCNGNKVLLSVPVSVAIRLKSKMNLLTLLPFISIAVYWYTLWHSKHLSQLRVGLDEGERNITQTRKSSAIFMLEKVVKMSRTKKVQNALSWTSIKPDQENRKVQSALNKWTLAKAKGFWRGLRFSTSSNYGITCYEGWKAA